MVTNITQNNREILKQILLEKAREGNVEYPLSYGQQALWYLYKEAPESIAYNLAFPLRIKSKIDVKALKRTFQRLVNRHYSLRTTFADRDGEAIQIVHGFQQVYFNEIDASDLDEGGLYQTVLNIHRQPFDMDKGPLYKVHLFCMNDNDYILLISAHHIIMDFQSFMVMNDELWQLYEEELKGESKKPLLAELQYKDFVNNQKKLVESTLNATHWKYWQDKLKGDLSALSLPIDYPRPPVQTYNGSSVPFTINKELTKALKTCASEEGVTLFVLLQAAYQLFLHRYSGQEDIIIGIPVNGRNVPGFDKIIGYLVNMLPIRIEFKENKTFKELLKEVKGTITEALRHQDYPFVALVDQLKLKRDPSRSPVFQVTFEYLSFSQNTLNNILYEPYDLPQQEGQFDMILTLEDTGETLNGRLNYNTDLFKEETIKNMSLHFSNLLKGIAEDIKHPISEIELLSEEEVYDQLIGHNQTKADYPYDQCVHQLFEKVANSQPNTIAVCCEGTGITYEQLNKKANRLARRLRFEGVWNDSVVGIMAYRSIECIVAMLAVLKAGGAYLPIDPAYPSERLNLILEDSGTKLLLTQKNINPVVGFKGTAILLDDDKAYMEKDDNLDCINAPNDLAYIIYTSGSTGKPKGAMIEHRGVVNYITWAIKQYGNNDKTGLTFPFYSSISFDLTVTSIYAPLLSGNRIEVYGEDDFCLDRILKEDKVDVIKLTPSHLKALLTEDISSKRLKSFIVGGEEFERKVAEGIHNKFNTGVIQYNEYGPTETVVGCMIYAYDPNKDKDKAVPIGVPSDNVNLYIFDQYRRLVPNNVIGELYIGGDGVCRGYLNRDELTSEKFIENPYKKGERIYKTGDLVRRRRDGIFEFIGRVDQQVKIRGYRIECGEIEEFVMKISSIEEAVVVIKEDSNKEKYLCCYYVSDENLSDEVLRKTLSEKMPHYMIPSKFILLDKMPLNQNGKIDRKLLTNKPVDSETTSHYQAASNPLEKTLCEIWELVLKPETVIGIHDNFFNLGGNSLLAIQVVQKLRKAGLTCKTSDLLMYPTIHTLAEFIGRANNAQSVKVHHDEMSTEEVDFTPVQSWFFEHFEDVSYYNQYVLLKCIKPINVTYLEKVFNAMINHHDLLRAYYIKSDSKWIQKIEKRQEAYQVLNVHDLSDLESSRQEVRINEMIVENQSGFDLSKPPLLKAIYFKLQEDKGFLAILMHHLITDFVSFSILIEDLMTGYEQLEKGMDIHLPDITSSFGTWTKSLEAYARGNDFKKDMDYWYSEAIKNSTNVVDLLIEDPNDLSYNTEAFKEEFVLSLSFDETESILRKIPKAHAVKGHELLLTCVVEALCNWTDTNNMLIEFEGHGRREIDCSTDLSRTIGWFTAKYPIHIVLGENKESLNRIKEVKTQLDRVPNNGFNYSILKHIKKTEGINDLPNAQISFNYLGDLKQSAGDDPFTVDYFQMSSGQGNKLSNLLSFNSIILNDRLHIVLSYSKNIFKEDDIKRLMDFLYAMLAQKIKDLDAKTDTIKICKKCILPETFPKIEIDEEGICNYCKTSEAIETNKLKDFESAEDLIKSLEKYKRLGGKYDVLVPLSGGVDSSATLIELVTKYKLKVLGFHNDHGYEDETATNNVRKLCKALNVDLIIKQHDTPFMKKLWKYSNQSKVKGLSSCFVCGGILYANAVEIAIRYDIPLIINGYSKGQATMMANKETALEFWEQMLEEFQQDEVFFEEFMERQKPMSKQKVYLTREDLEADVNPDRILVIPFYIFKFNKTDKVLLRKKCEALFDWQQMKTSYPDRTTNCDMVWLNTYMDLQRMQHTMYHEEYASLVRKGEMTRAQALSDLAFNPPEGVLERLANDIKLKLL